MTPTQRKRRRGRAKGRPEVAKHPKEDGARLAAALETFRWSQAEVAARTGISQFTLSRIISGDRSVGREDLRALAKIGIPADYVLGVSKELVPLGETRTIAKLEADVAARVRRDAMAAMPGPFPAFFEKVSVNGAKVLSEAVETVISEIEYRYAWEQDRFQAGMTRGTLRVMGGEPLVHFVDTFLQRVLDRTRPPRRFLNEIDTDDLDLGRQIEDAVVGAGKPKESTISTEE